MKIEIHFYRYFRTSVQLNWVSQKLSSAVLVLYAVSVMDGRSIMLEKWNGVQCDLGRKTPLGIIKNKKITEIKTRST